ncbi:hypothetical protein QBC35DRAFT_555638 [Podospora australis]|uniref:RGS domain-containing protein n=1 Tax=Podospora australis TaxID=1536484 RepID=A0AAN6X1L3_9PEZI|nr:hypothetical protein QBC35DRAFT_555638 [Podospora australis]
MVSGMSTPTNNPALAIDFAREKLHLQSQILPDDSNQFRAGSESRKGKGTGGDRQYLEPLDEEDIEPGGFDLLSPVLEVGTPIARYILEERSELLFSDEHLEAIFADPHLFTSFTAFLRAFRPTFVPLLSFYFDALKALKTIDYSNFILRSLQPLEAYQVLSGNPVWRQAHTRSRLPHTPRADDEPSSVERIRAKLAACKEHYETLLNYRRDGTPFMNLLMCSPFLDSHGDTRDMIGAQIDVSGLVRECAGLDSLQVLVNKKQQKQEPTSPFGLEFAAAWSG